MANRLVAIACMTALSACSDSGAPSPASPTPPTNSAPVFTSAATVSATEGTASSFYTAAATDADGDAVTFSISGGADQSLFSITPQGALSFLGAPNFETPGDADGDNAYTVTVTATDGAASVNLTLTATVTDAAEDFLVRRVATGFSGPLFLTGRNDGSGDVYVIERAGRIRILDPDTGAINTTPFLDISTTVSTVGEGGLVGFALAPDFTTSRTFYVHVTTAGSASEVRRYAVPAGTPDVADAASGDVILTAAQPADNHNGGWIGFGADDLLYIAFGDGGGSGDPFMNGQDRDSILGAILRIDPSGDDFPGDASRDYRIPPGNIFAAGGGEPEIYAYGLRNPFRASFDRQTGDLYIGDVGQGALEEVDFIPIGDGGENFGWNVREGTAFFAGADSPDFTSPIAEYEHGSGPRQGNSITGGYVYRGPVNSLQGEYFFTDFVSGNVWSFPISSVVAGQTITGAGFTLRNGDMTPDAGALGSIASMGEDDAGNLYFLGLFSGEIFRIEPR